VGNAPHKAVLNRRIDLPSKIVPRVTVVELESPICGFDTPVLCVSYPGEPLRPWVHRSPSLMPLVRGVRARVRSPRGCSGSGLVATPTGASILPAERGGWFQEKGLPLSR